MKYSCARVHHVLIDVDVVMHCWSRRVVEYWSWMARFENDAQNPQFLCGENNASQTPQIEHRQNVDVSFADLARHNTAHSLTHTVTHTDRQNMHTTVLVVQIGIMQFLRSCST